MSGLTLWGLADHPHTRRVAVALNCLELEHARRPMAEFAPGPILARAMPPGAVPVLSLPDGRLIGGARAIIEALDSMAPDGPQLSPGEERQRLDMLVLEDCALIATGAALELTAERLRRAVPEVGQIARLEAQLSAALDWIEPQAGAGPLVGGQLSRADLALACLCTFTARKWPRLWGARRRLMAHRAWAEALPAFRAVPVSLSERGMRAERGADPGEDPA